MLNLLCTNELFGTPPDACVEEYLYVKRGFWDHWLPLLPVVLPRIRIHTIAAITMTVRPNTPPTMPPISAPRDTDLVEVAVATVPPTSPVGVGVDNDDV